MEIYPDGTIMAVDYLQAKFILTDEDAGTLSHYQHTEPSPLEYIWLLWAGVGEWSNAEPDNYFVFARFFDGENLPH